MKKQERLNSRENRQNGAIEQIQRYEKWGNTPNHEYEQHPESQIGSEEQREEPSPIQQGAGSFSQGSGAYPSAFG